MTKNYRSQRYGLSIITSILCLCLTGVLYYYFSTRLPQKLFDQLEVTGNIAVRNLELALSDDILFIEYLEDYIRSHDDDYEGLVTEAERISNINEDIQALSYENLAGEVRNLLKTDTVYFKDYFSKSNKLSSAYSSKNDVDIEWYNTPNSLNLLHIRTPVFKNDQISGILHTGICIDKDLKNLGEQLDDYSFQLKDSLDILKYQYNTSSIDSLPDNLVYTAGVRPYNTSRAWTMYLFYKDAFVFNHSSEILNLTLFFGMLISILFGLFLFFYLKSLQAVKIAETSNMQLVQTNAALEIQRQAAQAGSQAKTTFLSNMSHEIRTPLNAILGLCELLKKRNDVDRDKYVNLLQDSSKTLLSLVNDILAIDRIESGKEELALDTFEPNAILRNVVSFYRSKVNEDFVTIISNLSNCDSYVVQGDRTKFEQISFNLLSNALKFTNKGKITVSCNNQVVEDEKLKLSLIVKDTGIGIPKSKQKEIFNRFTQLDEGLRKKHSGGGLGLSITQQFVELMGGTIKVESKRNKGTTFTVTLEFPVVTEPEKPKAPEELEHEQLELDTLVVDDNKLNVVILKKVLQNMGMKIDVAYDGFEALEKTENKKYDIIFMDVHMPKMDGYQTTERIRLEDKHCLILGLSADATKLAIEEGLRSGMNHYLTKPLDQDKLRKILQETFVEN